MQRPRRPRRRAAAALLCLAAAALASGAQAQPADGDAPPAASPAAPTSAPEQATMDGRAGSRLAVPRYRSALEGYGRYRADEPLRDWREVNDEVGRLRGHGGHLQPPVDQGTAR